MILLSIGIPAAVVVLILYACCRVAGDADRQAETLWIQKAEGEEEHPPVWQEEDRKYSGLLEEDEP